MEWDAVVLVYSVLCETRNCFGPVRKWGEQQRAECMIDADGRVIAPPFQSDGVERRLHSVLPGQVTGRFIVPPGKVNHCALLPGPLIVPEGVTEIGDEALKNCVWLASVTLPEGVVEIGRGAFRGCSSLCSVEIPEGVRMIGYEAFENCRSLVSVSLPHSLSIWNHCAFAGCTSLVSLSIAEGMTSIPFGAFFGCRSLVFVNLPESVVEVEDMAFAECDSLVAAVLPRSCRSIQEESFEKCPLLSLVVAPDGLEATKRVVDDDDGVEINYVPGGSLANVFAECPLLTPPTYVTPHTPAAVIAAQRLEYWTPTTHQRLCDPARRRWVFYAVLVLKQLELPRVVLLTVLSMLKRHELGPAAR